MTVIEQRPRTGLRTGTPFRGFRPDVEGLRAIAVLIVVLYHAGVPLMTGGYVGVSVFFVISGFLITLHLTQEITRTGTIRITRFYARRARRLLPAAALVLIVTVLASWILGSGLLGGAVGMDALWAAVFGANIHFAIQGVDYQANQDPSPVQHYWSLSVEEQFYLFWPLALLVVCIVGAKLLPRIDRRLLIAAAIVVFGAASFWYSQHLMVESSTIAYFLMPSRAWELGLGALVAVAAPWLVRLRLLQNGVVATGGLLMILAASTMFTDETPYPGTASLLPTVGTALVIGAGLRAATAPERLLLSRKPFQLLGKLSYSLYLWHWPALILAPYVLGTTLSLGEKLVVCALTVVLSMFSFVAVEEPFRTDLRLQRSTGKSLLVGLCAVLLTVAVSVAAITLGPLPYRTGQAADPADRDEIVSAVETAAPCRGTCPPRWTRWRRTNPTSTPPTGSPAWCRCRRATSAPSQAAAASPAERSPARRPSCWSGTPTPTSGCPPSARSRRSATGAWCR